MKIHLCIKEQRCRALVNSKSEGAQRVLLFSRDAATPDHHMFNSSR